MKCKSCEKSIDPQWTSAIEANKCPFCGNPLLDEYLGGLLASLKSTMKDLEQYPQETSDWLFSNYSYIKSEKHKPRSTEPEDKDDRTSVFFQRAEATKPTDKAKMKELVSKIKSGESDNLLIDNLDDVDVTDEEEQDYDYPETSFSSKKDIDKLREQHDKVASAREVVRSGGGGKNSFSRA